MSTKTSLLRLSAFLVLSLGFPSPTHAFSLMPSEVPATDINEWEVRVGDALIVDTTTNIGYLIHRGGGFMQFPVATGQRRVVRYIGRTYNARTPNTSWAILDKEVKGDRTTFGKEGLFLRLYDEDGETAYGIHSHRSIDSMLAVENRFRSMGCILVSQSVLDIIETTYEGNSRRLDVLTLNGFGDEPVTYETLLQKVAFK
ncbi:MAG: L,D-transpeptidase [Candidatus Peribacteraceae bacterium]|nr:L,D-transpeptidase [Candidatus Peribacteraceae bacterium]